MSVSGLCEVCGEGGAEAVCDRCGSFVCPRHYEFAVGFCVECAGEVGVGDPSSGEDGPDSTDTYRF